MPLSNTWPCCARSPGHSMQNPTDKLTDEFFHDLLDEHFTETETILQLETATMWGRYAELFNHDSAGKFFFIPEKPQEDAADSSS